MKHESGSLIQLIENIVKNWEIEASFKPNLKEWRTIDPEVYTFAIHGGKAQSADEMTRIGTYNAIILPNELYSPKNMTFAASHKTFKRMMPSFAWEVVEIYSGPPRITFKWRHWGVMENDYVGINDAGEKITVKAHGGMIDITGITIANVDSQLRIRGLRTYFDSMQMFRQISPELGNHKTDPQAERRYANQQSTAAGRDSGAHGASIGTPSYENEGPGHHRSSAKSHAHAGRFAKYVNKLSIRGRPSNDSEPPSRSNSEVVPDSVDLTPERERQAQEAYTMRSEELIHPFPRDKEERVRPGPGQAVISSPHAPETLATIEEMSKLRAIDCPFMNMKQVSGPLEDQLRT